MTQQELDEVFDDLCANGLALNPEQQKLFNAFVHRWNQDRMQRDLKPIDSAHALTEGLRALLEMVSNDE